MDTPKPMPAEIMQTHESLDHWLTGKGKGGGLWTWFVGECPYCRAGDWKHWEHPPCS